MTFAELYAETRGMLGTRADFTVAQAKAYVNRAYKRLCNAFQYYEIDSTDTSKSTVANTATVAIPTGAREIISIKITGDTEYEIIPKTIDWYERQDTTTANTGVPVYYVRYGSNILFWPTPDDAYALRVRYRGLPADMSSDNDTPVIPAEWHDTIVMLAASYAAFALGMAQRGQELKNEALGMLSAIQEDNTRDSRHRIGQVTLMRTRRSTRLGRNDPGYAENP